MSKKISVVGFGYVGLSMALLLSQNNKVSVYDNDQTKIESINNGKVSSNDPLVKKYLTSKKFKTFFSIFQGSHQKSLMKIGVESQKSLKSSGVDDTFIGQVKFLNY